MSANGGGRPGSLLYIHLSQNIIRIYAQLNSKLSCKGIQISLRLKIFDMDGVFYGPV